MNPSVLLRGVSAGALLFAFASECARAQQALPTIDIGGQRRAPSSRISGPPTGQPVAPAPGPSSRFPSEPRTPAAGYVVRDASTATKSNIPIMQTPASIEVVPKQVIQDQQATLLQDALENVSGVRSSNDDLNSYNFNIRGFQSLYIYRNNLAIPGGESGLVFDTANLERIEVLKGPSSILFGRAEPGGLINLVTKQPLDQPLYRVEQQIGSFDFYRTQWDFSTPIASIPGLAARVSGAYQNNGSFRKFHGGERVFIAPVVSYRPSDWTELTLDTQYLGAKAQSEVGVQSVSPGLLPVPLSRSFQEANDPRDRADGYVISYKFRQNIEKDWKVTNRFHYAYGNFTFPNLVPFCTTIYCIDPDARTLQRLVSYQNMNSRTFSTNIDLEGKFTTFGATHTALMGLDYLNSGYDYYFANGSPFYPIDIFNPVYGTVPTYAFQDGLLGTGFKFHSSVLTRQKGLYVQDYVSLLEDKLHLLIGARYDVAAVNRGRAISDYSGDPALIVFPSKEGAIADRLSRPTVTHTGWSARVGLLYDLLPQLSVYGSLSRSFGAQNGVGAARDTLPPQRGLQYEVGFKAEPLPGLTATLAFFQITKSGVGVRDFTSPSPDAQKLSGLQRSRGVELDVVGNLSDHLSLIGNYAYIDAKVISDDLVNRLNPFGTLDPAVFGTPSGLYGNHLANVPRHSGKVFAIYNFGESGLGWRLGLGVTASTQAWGDIQNTFLMPGWARLDGFASYTTLIEGHKLTAQLNLKNINNVQYYSGPDNFFYTQNAQQTAFPMAPFTATGTLRFEW